MDCLFQVHLLIGRAEVIQVSLQMDPVSSPKQSPLVCPWYPLHILHQREIPIWDSRIYNPIRSMSTLWVRRNAIWQDRLSSKTHDKFNLMVHTAHTSQREIYSTFQWSWFSSLSQNCRARNNAPRCISSCRYPDLRAILQVPVCNSDWCSATPPFPPSPITQTATHMHHFKSNIFTSGHSVTS
jgi:hypothetical protein